MVVSLHFGAFYISSWMRFFFNLLLLLWIYHGLYNLRCPFYVVGTVSCVFLIFWLYLKLLKSICLCECEYDFFYILLSKRCKIFLSVLQELGRTELILRSFVAGDWCWQQNCLLALLLFLFVTYNRWGRNRIPFYIFFGSGWVYP